MKTRLGISMGRLLMGAILVALGVILLLDQAHILSADKVISGYWPILIIAFGLVQIFTSPRSWIAGAIVVVVGLILLGGSLKLVSVGFWQLFWPTVLIALGLLFLFRTRPFAGTARAGGDDTVSSMVLFSGSRIVNRSHAFRGASLTALFGGLVLDLREARPAETGAVIDVTAAFGGIDILVPEGSSVRLEGLPIFGGMEDRTDRAAAPIQGAPDIRVRGEVVFGGVAVRNRPRET